MFENYSVNINALCISCEDVACCSSECVLTFLYAGDNIQYVNEQFVSRIHLFFCTLHSSSNPINKNLAGIWRSWWPVNDTATTDPPIRESVIEMLHHMSGIMRRGSVMLKVHSNPCSQRNIL